MTETKRVNERAIVLDVLLAVLEEGQYSHLVLSSVLDKYQYLDKRSRSFISRLSMGTIERKMELDFVIDSYSKTKTEKMKPVIREILRMSVYQLLFMDSVPDSAVCNEAVKLTKKRGFYQLNGFVNGVLRSIARREKDIIYPDLATKYSMPQWICDEFEASFGIDETEEILASFYLEKPLTIRTNTACISREELQAELQAEGLRVEVSEDLPYALFLYGVDHLAGLASFQAGHFYIQDLSSMMVADIAAPKEGDKVLDLCAAPGGKALHMAELLNGTGLVEARDLTENKVNLINDNIKRSKLTNIKAHRADARILDEACLDSYDVVLADLPCSGLGIIGRKPDIKYRITREDQLSLQTLQREILRNALSYVKVGGRICYSTCTICKAENEDNVAWILEEYPNYELRTMKQILPDEKQDGFFYALFTRTR